MRAAKGLLVALLVAWYGLTLIGAFGNRNWSLVVLLVGAPAVYWVVSRRPSSVDMSKGGEN